MSVIRMGDISSMFGGMFFSPRTEESSTAPRHSVFNDGHSSEMLEKLNHDRRTDQSLCDITICTGLKEFQVHKCVLGVMSTFFRKMFFSDMREKKESVANIGDVQPEIMELIIDYIYTCEIDITEENVYDILEAADYLQLDEVKNFCSHFLEEGFSVENCIMKWSFAHRYHMTSLIKIGELFIRQHFNKIINLKEITQMSADDFVALLKLRTPNADEETMYFAVLSWMKEDECNRKDSFGKVFRCIDLQRFSKCFLQEICEETLVMQSLECTNILVKALFERMDDKPPLPCTTDIVILGGIPGERKVMKLNIAKMEITHFPDMTLDRTGASSACVGRSLIVMGGHSKPASKSYNDVSMLKLDDPAREWTNLQPMNFNRRTAGCAVMNGIIYMCGGKAHDSQWLESCESFQPELNRWTILSNMVFRRSECAVVALEGRLYAIGGCSRPDSFLDSVECYDPQVGFWGLVSPMNTARAKFAAVVLNGEIYAIGGEGHTSYLSCVEKYNPKINCWSMVGSLQQGRFNHGACVIGGKIYTIGGLPSIEAYDPSINEWQVKNHMTRKLGASFTAI